MYRYTITISILKNGHKYYIIDVDDKDLSEAYYANLAYRLGLFKEEKINNSFEYSMTINKEKIVL